MTTPFGERGGTPAPKPPRPGAHGEPNGEGLRLLLDELDATDSIPPEDCPHPEAERVQRPGARNFWCQACETWVGPGTEVHTEEMATLGPGERARLNDLWEAQGIVTGVDLRNARRSAEARRTEETFTIRVTVRATGNHRVRLQSSLSTLPRSIYEWEITDGK